MKRALLAAALAGSILLPTSAHAAESWHSVTLPFLWPTKTILSLDASAPDNVWIAGNQGAFCIQFIGECLVSSPGNPVVRRWTGTSTATVIAPTSPARLCSLATASRHATTAG